MFATIFWPLVTLFGLDGGGSVQRSLVLPALQYTLSHLVSITLHYQEHSQLVLILWVPISLLPQDLVFFLQLSSELPDHVCDLSLGHTRLFVPESFRHTTFDFLHGLVHPGVCGMQALVGDRFVWPQMHADITQWCVSCTACQSSKVQQHIKAPVSSSSPVSDAFIHVHVDLLFLWPQSLLETVSDYCSSRVACFGIPLHITSDHGTQFMSSLRTSLDDLLGVDLHWTTSYHPNQTV